MTNLPSDVKDWPEGWRERYEERAAIMEHDGGLSKTEAEEAAESACRDFFSKFGWLGDPIRDTK